MKKLLCLLALVTIENAVPSPATAATLTIHLYDREGRPLKRGEAMIMVESPSPKGPDAKWTKYIGLSNQYPHYTENLPNEEVLNITIYTNQNTLRRDIAGVYGKQSQTFHLLADPEHMQRCGSSDTDYGISSDLVDLIDQLDRAYPNGAPAHLTNVKGFLKQTVIKSIDDSKAPDDPQLAKEKNDFRERVMKHVRAR